MNAVSDYQTFIAKSRYAKYIPDESRRESWCETVERYIDNVVFPRLADSQLIQDIERAIKTHNVLPSMRCLMTAGPALDRDHVAGYNCAFAPVDDIRVFDECLYILMCGTGVGFSVERQYTSRLPEVPVSFEPATLSIVVQDSKDGWQESLLFVVSELYAGRMPMWDLSELRPAGARLKTFGGRSSGPKPLDNLLKFVVHVFLGAAGRKLSSIECHDIMCKIGECVVVGGVRRSALISLSNLSDDRMRHAKSGQWQVSDPQRTLANNSVCYTERPTFDSFLREWQSLYESKCGERGIFNRVASKKCAARSGRRDVNHEFGTNPCSEIVLRPNQFCNLSEVVVRPHDTLTDLLEKVRLATIMGTIQATFTNFRNLRPIWQHNTEEERLLGVSLTGLMDHHVLSQTTETAKEWLKTLHEYAVTTNKEFADVLGIPVSTAIHCIKPSGTASQLVDSASGLHARFAPYYIRRVRNDIKDPISEFLMGAGVPWEVDITNPNCAIFSFPMKSPEGSVIRNDRSAIEQMEYWKMLQDVWCEHKPSATVYYKDSEFLALGQWVWDNFDDISGVAFLPYSDHVYEQAPYEEISEAVYHKLVSQMPTIDWSIFTEDDDYTVGQQTLACTGNACEI